MTSTDYLEIQVRRTDKSLADDLVKDKTPAWGEIYYIEGSDVLVIGNKGVKSIKDLKRIKLLSDANSKSMVFYKSDDKNALKDENDNDINPKSISENISHKSEINKTSNVKEDLDILDKKTKNLSPEGKQYALGDESGNALKPVSKSNIVDTLFVTGVKEANGELGYHTGVKIDASKGILLGAAWNDYAEYRLCTAKPGSCVVEQGDGKLKKSEKRLQRGCAIVSDTFGMVIGDNTEFSMPIAISGRVLAKCYSKKVKVGDPVCSGCDGSVSVMSKLECILFPDRIIGYVSEIPTYDKWNDVKVGSRIWIKVK